MFILQLQPILISGIFIVRENVYCFSFIEILNFTALECRKNVCVDFFHQEDDFLFPARHNPRNLPFIVSEHRFHKFIACSCTPLVSRIASHHDSGKLVVCSPCS
ncbi:hypothetical protein SLA2020_156900 [Shorea laevis]